MRGIVRALAAFMLFVLAPSVVHAQATLAGIARDTSGAVLPGVTVEASSPVLIEKVRTATTDETGRYSIPDLRPGDYTVTFSLTGFRTIVRSGVALSGTAVVTINADLTVGGVQETITVSGETPVVDLQSTTRQAVMDQESRFCRFRVRAHRSRLACLFPACGRARSRVRTWVARSCRKSHRSKPTEAAPPTSA